MSTKAKPTTNRMKGGVRQRGKGRAWSYTLYLGLQPAQRCVECGHREWLGARRLELCPKCDGELRETQEPRQFTKGGYLTADTARDALATMRLEYKGRGDATELLKPITLAEFLRDVWLPTVDRSGKLKQTTKEGHHRHVERHLIGPTSQPFPLGLTKLSKLTTEQIAAHYAKLGEGYVVEGVIRTKYGRPIKDKSSGKVSRGLIDRPGLSEKSLRRVHATMHVALHWATKKKYLLYNPATGAADDLGDADAPERELPAWSEEELLAFLASQRGTEYGALWHVLAFTGMRRGEALGLQCGDVDLDAATITVRRTRVPVKGEGRANPGRFITSGPKTKKPRVINLDRQTVDLLRSVVMSTVSPADFTDAASAATAASRWVFANAAGEPLNPNSVSYRYRKAVVASGQRPIPMHGLRHTHATLLLSRGVPVHIVSARLGHADASMTLNVYSHCLPKAQQAAVDVLDSVAAGKVA